MENQKRSLIIPLRSIHLSKSQFLRCAIIMLLLSAFNIFCSSFASAQQITVTGTVTNQQGASMAGVTVAVKGTSSGTLTDANGNYSIQNVPGNATIVFSFVGMTAQEIKVASRTKVDVSLAETAVALDEVIVVGYGTERKADLSGAVTQVNSKVLQSRSLTSLGTGLQGTISNLQISQSSFAPGTGVTFNVRGYTSINGGSPLILVDGVVQDPNELNPEDVESVSVLKDASSAAIYGARAAYGVVLITTKKGGKDQRPTFKLSSTYSTLQATRLPKWMDSEGYVKFNNYVSQNTTGANYFDQRAMDHILAYYNDPINNLPVYYDPAIDLDGAYKYSGNTQWADVLYKKSHMKQINASLSGGTSKTQYYFSYGFMGQDGLMTTYDDYYKRHNISINVNSDVFDWLSVSAKSRYTYGFQDHPSQNSTISRINWDMSPLIPIILPDGTWTGQGGFTNPFSEDRIGGHDHTTVNDLYMTGTMTIRPIKGMNINADYTFNPYSQNHEKYTRNYYETKANGTSVLFPWTNPNAVLDDNNNNYYKAINIYGDYSKSFGKNNFKLLIGYNQETKTSKFFSAQRLQLINNDLPAINRATGVQTVNGSETLWSVQGLFFRFNYDFAGKYLIEANGRYDGSSKFPKADRYAFFPSISGAWVVSKENFWDNLKPIVSNFKIRGSYGSLGNQNVSSDFPYVSSYGITTAPTTAQAAANASSYIFAGATPVCILAGGLVSPSFTWEKVNQWDIGTDLGFLTNKLTVTFDYYVRATIGMLTAGQTLPAVLGTEVPSQNAADLKTRGWDLDVAWKDNIGDFSYNISANLSDALAEITKFNNPTGLLSSTYVGQKVGEIWGYDVVGLFQTAADITVAPGQAQLYSGTWLPGDIQYVDRNHDGVITRGLNTLADPGDQHVIGNNTPRYLYGVTLGGSWKGIDLNVFVQGVAKRDWWFSGGFSSDHYFGTNGSGGFAPFQIASDYWRPDNTSAWLPNSYLSGWGTGGHGNRQRSSRYLQNGAYMRLKQVTLGYTLPQNLTKKVAISQARIYCTMQNILTFTKMTKLIDPELANDRSYPMPMSYDFGISLTF